MLVADADVPDPVIEALKILGYGIVRYNELNLPIRPDGPLMEGVLANNGVLLTKDNGIPSQAYLFQYAQHGLTVVVLRWKQSNPKAWQEMAETILRDGASWEELANHTPSVISVTRRGSRPRAWSTIPADIAQQAAAHLKRQSRRASR
jgi:hypothetical protein